MRAPLSWLRELTPLAADARDRASVAELASELDALGLVVEGVEWTGEGLEDVVLAQVLEIASIEGADRIRRVVVDNGGGETTEVVCGAWNFEVGDVVPLAPVGSELPGGFKIERRKMRGVTSNGMLCSGRELGLSEDHEGILVVERPAAGSAPAAELGGRLTDHLGFGPDVVFDLAIEPNRPDCLSMLGVARDLAAHYSLPLHIPEPVLTEVAPAAGDLASVEVVDADLCQRILGRVLEGVRLVASEPIVQRRLVLAGMRPINSVVDASNYVMLEFGQPSHPYDLDELGGHGLKVRAAHPGETIKTLDGETRILGGRPPRAGDPSTGLDCLICNANDLPVGIAGVIGGQSSEISDSTSRVLLEVARFAPVAIGRTARHIGLRTEASVRFERGIDPEGMERAAARVCELIQRAAVAAGVESPSVSAGIVDSNPRPYEAVHVSVRPARVNSLLGTAIEADQMVRLLEPIGYEVTTAAGDTLEVVAPSWRPDVRLEVDVIEDVARTHGYRRIPRTERRSPYVGRLDTMQALRRQVRRVLTGVGAHEAWTSSIMDPADLERAGWTGGHVRITNPMVAEESVLRSGMLAGLLRAVRFNAGHRNPWLRLFEVGDIFLVAEDGIASAGTGSAVEAHTGDADTGSATALPNEHERLALVLALEDDDAGSALSAWRVLADALGIVGVEIQQITAWASDDAAAAPEDEDPADAGADAGSTAHPLAVDPWLSGLHPSRSGLLVIAPTDGSEPSESPEGELAPGTLLGSIGEVDPDVLFEFGLPHSRVGWLELRLDVLAKAPRRPLLAEPVSRYPSSDLDLAFSVDESVPAARLEEVLRLVAPDRCESVALFDAYRGAGLEAGHRSLAFRLRLCAVDHTLAESEVAELRQRYIDAVETALPARLRA